MRQFGKQKKNSCDKHRHRTLSSMTKEHHKKLYFIHNLIEFYHDRIEK